MTLSRRIVIGLAAGIACGLFFGEICGGLSIVGNAYIALMQMTVLPYIVLALIVNIGGLTLDTARHLAVKAAVVMLALLGIATALILLMPLGLPEWKTGGFFSTSLLHLPESVDFLSLYIPANPFRSLADNLVPAVVLFCICAGIALIGITRKESVIEPMRVMLDAMSRVTLWVAGLTPYGVFAIAARNRSASGVHDHLHYRCAHPRFSRPTAHYRSVHSVHLSRNLELVAQRIVDRVRCEQLLHRVAAPDRKLEGAVPEPRDGW
jgi:Na+/H+-dicarboxylate symporter